jgi:TusE/DsrC/DsvC family sulfur relay protein
MSAMTNTTTISFDTEGYLVNPEDWTKSIAVGIAEREGIELLPDHWLILEFMQQYWTTHRVAPDVRHVIDFLAEHSDLEKRAAKTKLFDLFPYGYVHQACKIAGMQRPRAWSTG